MSIGYTDRSIYDSEVCVIGGAGFLGSHLVNYLIEDRRCNVLVLDNLITGRRKYVHPKAEFLWHDIRDEESQLKDILLDFGIEYVFNYAAEPYIPECFDRPLHFFDINAVAVLRVLNACQAATVKGVLQVSSAEIYGNLRGSIKETDTIEPHSTYGVSKLAADGIVQVRFKEAGVPVLALRQFNCIGERETHDYVVPEIITQIDRHKSPCEPDPSRTPVDDIGPAKVYLGNNSSRDFMYAGDAVEMAVELLEYGTFGEVYNLGSEESVKIYDLALIIGQVMDCGVDIREDPQRKRPWEIWQLRSDNKKIYDAIRARPRTTLLEGLKKTVQYFWDNGCRWD